MKQFIILLCSMLILGCQPQSKSPLSKSFINPASGYTQVVTTNYNGLTTIYVSGQIGEGEDLAAQMEHALLNLEAQLKEAGASFKDIVKMNSYIVDYRPEDLAVFRGVRKEIMGDTDMPASTLVGVTALALPEWLIELDAVAVIEEK